MVGESGCGKSTMARCLLKLLEPSEGQIIFQGRDISTLSRRDMRPIERELMMVFQDPYASLNARKRVGFIIAEALDVHGVGTAAERKRRVQSLWRSSASTPSTTTASRTSSPAASGSGSGSPRRSPSTRR